jgi:hypothetical protein
MARGGGGGFLELSSPSPTSAADADDDEERRGDEAEGETARLTHINASDGTLRFNLQEEGRWGRRWGRSGGGTYVSGAAAQTAAYTVGFVVLGFMVGLIGRVGGRFARFNHVILQPKHKLMMDSQYQ